MNLMDTLFNLLQILMDAGLILLCCQTVFKEREHWGEKGFPAVPCHYAVFYGGEGGDDSWKPLGPSVCQGRV